IQQALDSNPMLEVTEDDHGADYGLEGDFEAAPAASNELNRERDSTRDNEAADAYGNELDGEDSWNESIPNDLPVDTAWDDIYQGSSSTGPANPDDDYDFESRNSVGESLQDH